MNRIVQIAQLITEDPDLFIISEAPEKFYLPAFKKSLARIPREYTPANMKLMFDNKFLHSLTGWAVPDPATGKTRPALIKDLPPDEWLFIIGKVKAIVAQPLIKFEPYYMNQVLTGHLSVTKIDEDSERLNKTVAMFVKMSRKAVWDGEKDIFKYPDWRLLEQKLLEFADNFIDYDASQDSVTLHKKSYTNNAISLLLGGPPEVTTYWCRSVTTPEAASKYGKGTTWCTSSDPAPRGTPEYDRHYAHQYIKGGGLYIIEMQSPTKPRRPILQISGDQFMDVDDTPVSRLGPRLKDFLLEVLKVAGDKIHTSATSTFNGSWR